MKKRSVSRNFNKNISSKKNKNLWWIIALIIIIGVFIVAYRYYGESLNIALSPLSTGCPSGTMTGSAGCYYYLETKSKFRVYFNPASALTDSYGKKYLNLKVFIDGGSASGQTFKCMLNSYSYCLTPVDSLAFEITDTLGNKDCVQTTSVYNGASYVGSACVNPNIISGVAYPQFSDLAWNYPAGKVIFWNNEETDPVEVYPGFDYSSGNSILSKTFVTETISTQVGKGIYSSESIAFNLESSRPGDNLGSGAGVIYEMNMTLKDGNNIIFRASSYCDLTSGANGVKKTTIEGIGLPKKVITAASCPLTFGGSEGNGVDSRVELTPNDLSLGKGRAKIMGTEYFFNPATDRPLTLEFKVSRRNDMRHNLRLTKFDGGPGNPNKLARPRAPLVLNWEKGSYLQSINKWVWNTGTQTVSNVKVKAEIISQEGTRPLIGVYQSVVDIDSKSEKKTVLKPISAGVGTTIDPSRGIHLPYDNDGTCYDIKFYVNNQFFDEGFDICVGK